jgi:hypothetical protein
VLRILEDAFDPLLEDLRHLAKRRRIHLEIEERVERFEQLRGCLRVRYRDVRLAEQADRSIAIPREQLSGSSEDDALLELLGQRKTLSSAIIDRIRVRPMPFFHRADRFEHDDTGRIDPIDEREELVGTVRIVRQGDERMDVDDIALTIVVHRDRPDRTTLMDGEERRRRIMEREMPDRLGLSVIDQVLERDRTSHAEPRESR